VTARRLRVELAPSASLTIALVASHAAAGLAVLAVLPGTAGAMLAVLLATLGVAFAWSRALHRSRSSIKALELGGDRVDMELASGERLSAEAAQRRYVGRYLVLIRLVRPGRRSVLVTRDMTDAESFRRLRVWALWGRFAVAAKQLSA
jgi:hypothetical protein